MAGEMRVALLTSNVAAASIGARSASPIDVLELLRISSATEIMATMTPKHAPGARD